MSSKVFFHKHLLLCHIHELKNMLLIIQCNRLNLLNVLKSDQELQLQVLFCLYLLKIQLHFLMSFLTF